MISGYLLSARHINISSDVNNSTPEGASYFSGSGAMYEYRYSKNKALRGIVDVPWYYRNDHLHRDLKIPTSRQEIQRFAERHERSLHNHLNTEVLQLLDQCFSTAEQRPSSGPWHQLYWAARGSSGICHFHFLSTHRIHRCTLYDYAIINY
jgi:hypothetical protein